MYSLNKGISDGFLPGDSFVGVWGVGGLHRWTGSGISELGAIRNSYSRFSNIGWSYQDVGNSAGVLNKLRNCEFFRIASTVDKYLVNVLDYGGWIGRIGVLMVGIINRCRAMVWIEDFSPRVGNGLVS